MKNRRHIFVSLLLLISFSAVIYFLARGLGINPSNVPSALIGKPASPFNAKTMQGSELVNGAQSLTLDLFKGKKLVLNYFASWCVSCREEAHELQKFWLAHKDEVAVVGIAIQDTEENALKFAQYYGKTYVLGLDQDGKASIDYGVYGVPETFIINREGIIIHKEAGPVTAAMLESYLPKM